MESRCRTSPNWLLRGVLIAAALARTPVAAQQPAPPASATKLKATITKVIGLVQVRTGDDKPWTRAQPGMDLDENAEFRTGPRSAVQFVIPPDQTVALDRLGTMKILQAVNDNGRIRTEIGMPYGRTRYDLESADGGLEHQATLRSPSTALGVRGTRVSLTDQRPYPPEAVSLTGRADFKDQRKQIAFGRKDAGKTRVSVDQPSAAAVELAQSFIDPTLALARSPADARLVETLISRGSTFSLDRPGGIAVVRGGTPPTDAQLVPALPGFLNVVARWPTNSDLNLSVAGLAGGEFIYPTQGLNLSPGGGRTAFDHRGGAHGGIEVVYWPAQPPGGLYSIGLFLASGPSTTAQVDVFQDGRRIPYFDFGPDGIPRVASGVVQVDPPTAQGVEGTAVGILPVDVPFFAPTPQAARKPPRAAPAPPGPKSSAPAPRR